MQRNSDIDPLEFTWGQSPARDSPHFRYQMQVQWASRHLHIWANDHKFGGPHHSLRLANLQERLREFKEALNLRLQFYYKGYKSKPVKRKDPRGDIWEGPKHAPSMSSRRITLLAHWCMATNQGSSIKLQCQVFNCRHRLTDSITGHVSKVSL